MSDPAEEGLRASAAAASPSGVPEPAAQEPDPIRVPDAAAGLVGVADAAVLPVGVRDAAAGPGGVPDAYQRLWVPHRMAYISSNHTGPSAGGSPDGSCPFCEAPKRTDEEALIVHRGRHAYVLLNLFPYNSGHLLICPYRHVALYDDATPEEVGEIAALTQTAMRVVRQDSRCDGFNIGFNQGRIAGAGVADHLHEHLVPRWAADANFFPIIAGTKALPVLLGDTWRSLHEAWSAA